MTKPTASTKRLLAFVWDNEEPFTTARLMVELGVSRRTVERSHRYLKSVGVATLDERMTRHGRQACWSYDLAALPGDVLDEVADVSLLQAGRPA